MTGDGTAYKVSRETEAILIALIEQKLKMSERTDEVKSEDRALALSLQYLECVERNLGIDYDSQGQPICVPCNITLDALSALKNELRELLSGEVASGAIEASKEFGQEH